VTRHFVLMSIALVCLAYFEDPVRAQSRSAQQQLAVDIYKELVEINTVTATGDTARAAEAMAARLRAAGFSGSDVQVFTPAPRKGNLVARLRGTGARKPILLLAHLDVVEARREDWSVDPFKLIEKDGYFYGRGTADDKFMAAAFVANLIRYKQDEDRLQPARRARDHAQHVGGGGLLLQRFAQLVQQPSVLDGDQRLIGKGSHQLDLFR
jgi:acetylornithine deacetylase/succinyl-diaminopimelate desuccinylase-like protein